MTRFRRCGAALLAGLLFAALARAQPAIPSPFNSIIGGGTTHERINLAAFVGGTHADSLSPGTTLRIVIRDFADDPIPGAIVVLDFTDAYTDFELSSVQDFHGETAALVPGGTKRVTSTTGNDGSVLFAVTGGGLASGAPHAPHAARVIVEGFGLGTIGVGVYDRSGRLGQDGADLAAFVADYFGAANPDRSDYDGDGTITLADLAMFARYYFGPRQTSATGTLVAP